MPTQFGLLFRTVKYLKPIQIFGRILFKLYRPRVNLAPPPKISEFNVSIAQTVKRKTSFFGPSTFRFLNVTGHLEPGVWNSPKHSKLWIYNLHYFDDLNAQFSKSRTDWHLDLLDRWIVENPPGLGYGWEPYPTSLRIVNWIKWSQAKDDLPKNVIESLAIQVRWLEKRLEWHLLGNHLFSNAKAMVLAGLFFEGPEARGWLAKGMRILDTQIGEQILWDGAQFELSTMYQALAIEDILDLINFCVAYKFKVTGSHSSQVNNWIKLLPKMLEWLITMSHPDGKIAFFNDAAFGIAPENADLISYANRLGIHCEQPKNGITDLGASGFVRLQSEECVVIADLAEIGPTYLPGHAHADSLSFELSLAGHRLFVNSGTSEYSYSNERLRQRGTTAHNTVNIQGKNSSEVWMSFRVGERARIISKEVCETKDQLSASATHNGFYRCFKGPLHCRNFILSKKNFVVMETMSEACESEVRYHLHPSVRITKDTKNSGKILFGTDRFADWKFTNGTSVSIEKSTWHPEFGVTLPSFCLVANFAQKECKFVLSWE